jgi:hypothetical protein
MSSRHQEVLALYDPRLDQISNNVLTNAEKIRIASPIEVPLINTKLVILGTLREPSTVPLLAGLPIPVGVIHDWYISRDFYFGDYSGPWTQESKWDQHVDEAIETAYQQARIKGLMTATPELFIPRIIESDPIQDLAAGFNIRRTNLIPSQK